MTTNFDVGATLQLKNVARFRGDADVAAESVDNIREKADRTSRSLTIMGKIGRGAGRAALTGLKSAALGAGVAVAAIGAYAIHASLEAQDAQAQIVAGIKSTQGAAHVTAREIDNLSTRVQRYSGISDELVKQGGGILLTFTSIRNEVGKGNDIFNQALTMSADLATRFKTDLPNASKILGKALQDPIRGVTALRRVGVDFNQQQTDQIKALVQSNNLLGAQKLILAELNKEVGGSARAAGRTDRGRFDIFKQTVQNSLERVGSALLPAVTGVLPMLAKSLVQLFVGLAPVLKQVATALGKALPGVIHALLPAVKMLGGLFATLARVAGPIIRILANVFTKVLRALLPGLKAFLEAIAKALIPLLKAFAPLLISIAKPLGEILLALVPVIDPLARLLVILAPLLKPVMLLLFPLGLGFQLLAPLIKVVGKGLGWLTDHVLIPLAKALMAVVHAIMLVVDWFKKLPTRVSTSMGRVSVDQRSALARDLGLAGHRAAGGPMLAMRPYIVGENGPELVVPATSQYVIPNQRFSMPQEAGWDGAASGRPVTVNVVINESNDPKKTLEAVRKGVQDAMARA